MPGNVNYGAVTAALVAMLLVVLIITDATQRLGTGYVLTVGACGFLWFAGLALLAWADRDQ